MHTNKHMDAAHLVTLLGLNAESLQLPAGSSKHKAICYQIYFPPPYTSEQKKKKKKKITHEYQLININIYNYVSANNKLKGSVDY